MIASSDNIGVERRRRQMPVVHDRRKTSIDFALARETETRAEETLHEVQQLVEEWRKRG